jgi:hypothetical protein
MGRTRCITSMGVGATCVRRRTRIAVESTDSVVEPVDIGAENATPGLRVRLKKSPASKRSWDFFFSLDFPDAHMYIVYKSNKPRFKRRAQMFYTEETVRVLDAICLSCGKRASKEKVGEPCTPRTFKYSGCLGTFTAFRTLRAVRN